MAEIEVPHEATDPFTMKVALCVAIYAVILAVAGTGGKNAGKDMLIEQMAASSRWAQYQAKTVRETIYKVEYEKLEVEKAKGGMSAEAVANMEKAKAKLEEYDKDKKEIKETAEGHEKAQHKAHTKDNYFDFAELFLQIAIVLASVAMLAKARWAFLASAALVAVGLLLTFNGYTLMFHIGLIEGGGH